MQRRVEAEISDTSGQLEDQSLDLDARTMAILGKRQQLSVGGKQAKTDNGYYGSADRACAD